MDLEILVIKLIDQRAGASDQSVVQTKPIVSDKVVVDTIVLVMDGNDLHCVALSENQGGRRLALGCSCRNGGDPGCLGIWGASLLKTRHAPSKTSSCVASGMSLGRGAGMKPLKTRFGRVGAPE